MASCEKTIVLGHTEWEDLKERLTSAAEANDSLGSMHHATESEKVRHLRIARILRDVAEQIEAQS